MTLCHVDHTGFHHLAVTTDQPHCRCGQKFGSWLAFDQHLDAVSIGTVSHDVGERM